VVDRDSGKDKQLSKGVDLFTKLALDVIPGVGLAKTLYEAYAQVCDGVSKYQERKYEERAKEFHRSLLSGTPSLIASALDVEDYHALLNACLEDIENDKSARYGTLARSIGSAEVKDKYRRFLILTLSQLSLQQIEKLRKAWIASTYTLVTSDRQGSIPEHHYLAGDSSEIMDEVDLEFLSSKKLVIEQKITVLGKALVESCYDSQDLRPEAIGEVSWVGGALDIITGDTGNHSVNDSSTRLTSLLRAGLVQAHFRTPDNSFSISKHILVLPFCLVLVKSEAFFLQNFESITMAINGRKCFLAFLDSRIDSVIDSLPNSELLDASQHNHTGEKNILNAIQSAVRRSVTFATK
jgi:hypothetical protein